MKPAYIRLLALAAGIAVILSCDSAPPTAPGSAFGGSKATTGKAGVDVTPPTVTIDTPTTGTLVNIGDSILVTVHLHDDQGLAAVHLFGFRETGNIGLGTFARFPRYGEIDVINFRSALRDTVIRRYLQPVLPVDTTIDSLVVMALVADSAGNVDSTLRRVNIVAGPKITITSPLQGDSVPAGVSFAASAHGLSAIGVSKITMHVFGEANWPSLLDTTVVQTYSLPNNRDVTVSANVRLPANAPVRGRITVTATASDINSQPGSALPITAFVRSGNNAEPRVFLTVGTRIEANDSVLVSANGDGIAALGFVVRDTIGNLIKRDSVLLAAPFVSNASKSLSLGLLPVNQGKRVAIYAFAVDQAGRTGYSLLQGTSVPDAIEGLAFSDTALIVYGQTFPLPRNGVVADVTVDPLRGNVFLSNTQFNLLELWQGTSQRFDSLGIAVGSQPWGMVVSNNPDTLLVANSGATTISRVAINSTDPRSINEDLNHRIRTRNTFTFLVTESRDQTTGKTLISAQGPFSYSDRPEYIQQSAGGRIFYSTKPTLTAPTGTVRWLDPSLAVPDPEQIWQFGGITSGQQIVYALLNVDSIAIGIADPSSNSSDTLFIWDHPYGAASGTIAVHDTTTLAAVAQANAAGSDAVAVLNLDLSSIGLQDTTFTAASGDRKWIGFGEGNSGNNAGRVIMVNDPSGGAPSFFSPLVTVADLTDNASEHVTGLAIDATGQLVAAHGLLATYQSYVNNPFHLRLQGSYSDSVNSAGGVAFHPSANGEGGPAGTRVGFSVSHPNQIDIYDVAQFQNRGTLKVKNPVYGPLRVSLPFPTDPPSVVLKLFAMTSSGMVVINLTAADIKP
jgi:hypothetical protein